MHMGRHGKNIRKRTDGWWEARIMEKHILQKLGNVSISSLTLETINSFLIEILDEFRPGTEERAAGEIKENFYLGSK